MRNSATCTCPKCYHVFRTLDGEARDHACPRCGYYPYDDEEIEDQEGD